MKKSVFIILAVVVGLVAGLLTMQPVALSQSKEPIKIGMIADSTGGLAAYGYSHERCFARPSKRSTAEEASAAVPLSFTWRIRKANRRWAP